VTAHREHSYFVYLMANRSRTLYCGVTSSIRTRAWEHKNGEFQGFTSQYKCDRLVWFEPFQYVDRAIAREKQIKRWRREKKVALITEKSPTWEDLSADWF
jgi:putative endonuclease